MFVTELGHAHQPHLACPKCSHHTVVNHDADYVCVNLKCGYRFDVTATPPPEKPKSDGNLLNVLLIIGALFLCLDWITNGSFASNPLPLLDDNSSRPVIFVEPDTPLMPYTPGN